MSLIKINFISCCKIAKKDLEENENTIEFGKYFESEWMKIPEQWAKCHRHGLEINTNMYLEWFHKALKYGDNHYKSEQGTHMDKCI